jgi:hypothetical protein
MLKLVRNTLAANGVGCVACDAESAAENQVIAGSQPVPLPVLRYERHGL